MGPFLLEDNPFKTVNGLADYAYDQGLGAWPPRFPRFILVVSSSDTLFVFSTLESSTFESKIAISLRACASPSEVHPGRKF